MTAVTDEDVANTVAGKNQPAITFGKSETQSPRQPFRHRIVGTPK